MASELMAVVVWLGIARNGMGFSYQCILHSIALASFNGRAAEMHKILREPSHACAQVDQLSSGDRKATRSSNYISWP